MFPAAEPVPCLGTIIIGGGRNAARSITSPPVLLFPTPSPGTVASGESIKARSGRASGGEVGGLSEEIFVIKRGGKEKEKNIRKRTIMNEEWRGGEGRSVIAQPRSPGRACTENSLRRGRHRRRCCCGGRRLALERRQDGVCQVFPISTAVGGAGARAW